MKVGRLLHEFGEKVALFGQIRTNCTNFTPDLSKKRVGGVSMNMMDTRLIIVEREVATTLCEAGLTTRSITRSGTLRMRVRCYWPFPT